MSNLFIPYLIALITTIIIESFIILPCFRSHYDNFRKLVINFILINCITNLSLNILVLIFNINLFTLALELIIPVAEAYMFEYAGVNRRRSTIVTICFIANILSFIIGIFIFGYLGLAFAPQPMPLINGLN